MCGKVPKSVKNAETILPFSCCPLVLSLNFESTETERTILGMTERCNRTDQLQSPEPPKAHFKGGTMPLWIPRAMTPEVFYMSKIRKLEKAVAVRNSLLEKLSGKFRRCWKTFY